MRAGPNPDPTPNPNPNGERFRPVIYKYGDGTMNVTGTGNQFERPSGRRLNGEHQHRVSPRQDTHGQNQRLDRHRADRHLWNLHLHRLVPDARQGHSAGNQF